MCRGKIICTELGEDQSKWDKYCPLRLPEIYSGAVDTFVEAVGFFMNGRRDECLKLLATIDNQAITSWYIEHGQMSGLHRNRVICLKLSKPLPIEDRYPLRSPIKLQNNVFSRDGYRCRYCGNKLIDQDFLRTFVKLLSSPGFTKGTTNLTCHAIIHLTWPVADHVIPWSRGGETTMDNLVSACATCNYGKAEYTIEQIGITNPLDRQIVKDNWDGLISLMTSLTRFSVARSQEMSNV